jgi:hypothetical protein
MAVRVLSFHATYACRDAGVCCTSAWPIPVERDRLAVLQDALSSGALQPAAGTPGHAWCTVPDAPADTPAVLSVAGTQCVFFDTGRHHHCRIHHALGHSTLPLACRQFPRVTVQTPLGPSVTLSHYCPTAAGLLRGDEPVRIVSDAPAFPVAGEYVGLDARDALPPLLRPEVLMDWEAWHRLEDHSVDVLCNVAQTPEEGLGRLREAVERLRAWRPGSQPLLTAVDEAFHRTRGEASEFRLDTARRVAEVLGAAPQRAPGTGPPLPEHVPRPLFRAPREVEQRFLAAHAFASWTGYQGRGLRAWLRGIEAAYALLDAGYGVARADLLLRHLADATALTRVWNRAEIEW